MKPETGAGIEHWAARWLSPDTHGTQYLVSSLYFDTTDSRVYRRDGSFGRAKYRIRRYGDSPQVFLERKLRTNQVVVKRRAIVDIGDIQNLAGEHWFQRRLQVRALRPAWQISYLRTACERQTNFGPIRLTLDRHLAAAPLDAIAFDTAPETTLFDNQEMILELKFRRAMPELFRDLAAEFSLKPRSVSKFRLAAAALTPAPAEANCA